MEIIKWKKVNSTPVTVQAFQRRNWGVFCDLHDGRLYYCEPAPDAGDAAIMSLRLATYAEAKRVYDEEEKSNTCNGYERDPSWMMAFERLRCESLT